MRRILVAVAGTLSGLGLILLYPTSTGRTLDTAGTADGAATAGGATSGSTAQAGDGAPSGSGAESGSAAGSGDAAGATTPDAAGSTGSGSTGSGSTGTYSASTSMRYGTVTVTVTVTDGRLTDVGATQDSPDGRSRSISGQAIPTLNSEALDAQSADIALVSHATYTSEAYAQSLQAALDEAAQA